MMPRACDKLWKHIQQTQPPRQPHANHNKSSSTSNGTSSSSGHSGKDYKYIGINKFHGKSKENVNNWLEHAATKLCASQVPRDLWVQEAGKQLFEAAGNWFATWVNDWTDEQLDNWEDFKRNLANNFQVIESLQYIAIQLMDLPHKTTLTQYAADFEEIHQKILNPAQADNIHIRAAFLNHIKPSMVALIRPEQNTSMPVLIAEAIHAEKRASIEYNACSGHCNQKEGHDKQKNNHQSKDNRRKRPQFNKSQSNQKEKKKTEVNNAKIKVYYNSDPSPSDTKGLLPPTPGKDQGDQA